MQMDEVRLNQEYASHLVSEFKEGSEGDSKPIIKKRIIRTGQLIEKLKSNVTVQHEYKVDHLFPPNCRYYEQYNAGFVIVIEEPPAFRTIAVDKDMSNEIESLKSLGKLQEYGYENWANENSRRPYMFNLAIPYSVFFLAFNHKYEVLGGSFFFRSAAISGFNDPLCKAPFLNINENQSVCFGDSIYKGPKKSIFSDTQHAVGSFWSASFNPDYIYNYVLYQNVAGLCDYLTWEYYSHKDPMFVYTADWIKYDKNVGDMIDRARGWVLRNDESYREAFNYNTLASLFNAQKEMGMAEVPGIGVSEPLIYDVCQYMYIGGTPVYIGDSFQNNKGETLYVDSFLGFRQMSNPSYINLQREDGKMLRMTLTSDFRVWLEKKILETRFESEVTLSNGLVVKTGDIIEMKNMYGNTIYRKVKYLRKSQDGSIEGRLGSEFYIMESMDETTTVLDIRNPEYMGIKLNQDTEYFILKNAGNSRGPNMSVRFCKFKEITTGSRGNLVMNFEETRGRNSGSEYKLNYSEDSGQNVFKTGNIRELPPVFRIGRKLMYSRSARRGENGEFGIGEAYVIPEQGVALPQNTTLRSAPYRMIEGSLLDDNTLKVAGWDLDIEFSIGDKVVLANWYDPIDMLTVKHIEGFAEDRTTGSIRVLLVDKNNKSTTYQYIDGRNAIINIGTMRKITNKWEDLSAGTKIKSRIAGFSMFPKKDCNIIIGFLYDTGGPEPLVLCSNACTLWYSDVVEYFSKTPVSDPKWKDMVHAPINPGKMRVQSGDILNGKDLYGSSHGYIAFKPQDSRTIRALQIQYFTSYMESYGFDRSFSRDTIFDCFPMPRLTSSQENMLGFVHAYPNFHGMYTKTNRYVSPYLFANEPRSMLNVSNSGE